MAFNKKWTGSFLAVLSVALLLSFQNCSNNTATLDGSSNLGSNDGSSNNGGSTIVSYPSITNAITIRNGQKITLKIQTPAFTESASNYMWYAYNDGNSLMAKYGIPVFANGYMYISLSVRSDVTMDQNVRILMRNFVNTSLVGSAQYLDQKGIWVIVKASTSASVYTQDAVSELCSASGIQSPTFTFNRSAASASALIATDNGAGINGATCTFGSTTVDCFKTAGWPTNWATAGTLTVFATNRCGGNITSTH